MAADKSLVQGAYRAAMANVTKDQSKFFEAETKAVLGFGEAVAKKAIEIDAGPPKDEDFEKAGELFIDQATQMGQDYQLGAQQYYESLSDEFYNAGDDKFKKSAVKQKVMTGQANMKTVVDLQEKLHMPGALNNYKMSDKLYNLVSNKQFLNSTYDHGAGEIVFGDKTRMSVKDFERQMQELPKDKNGNVIDQTKIFISDTKKKVLQNSQNGFAYDNHLVEKEIKESILSTDLDIQDFAKKDNFNNADGSFTNFKTVILENPEVAKYIDIDVENDPKFKSFDVSGNDGKITQADLDVMLKEMKGGEKNKKMNQFVDILLNPDADGYNRKITQSVIAKTISKGLEMSEHKQGETNRQIQVNALNNKNQKTLTQSQIKQKTLVSDMSGTFDQLPSTYILDGGTYIKQKLTLDMVQKLGLTADQVKAIGVNSAIYEVEMDDGEKRYATPYDMVGKLGPNSFRKDFKGSSIGSLGNITDKSDTGGNTIFDKINRLIS